MREFAVAVSAFALLTGCGLLTPTKQELLEGVAKDWSMTIRASQVLPVYPLTEDLQPGDIFLVRLPIERQVELWKDKGYLPLDNHIARVDPCGYCDFYDHSFLAGADGEGACDPGRDPGLPAAWRRRGAVGASGVAAAAWESAPHAGFPTYSFSVQSSGGLNLAVPVSGVPVGLGLLGADAASGTISIGKARTLGIDQLSLYADVVAWAAKHSAYLARYQSHGGEKNYLRVVSRIYLTGELDVSLRDASSRSAGLDVGAPKSVAVQMLETPTDKSQTAATAAKNYAEALKNINASLATQPATTKAANLSAAEVPGGSLRVTSVSAGTISMKETLDPPLVIGYLGFDCEIGPGGLLGPPVPTLAKLEQQLRGEADLVRNPVAAAWADSFYVSIYELLRTAAPDDEGARASVQALDALANFVPGSATLYSNAPGVALKETDWSVGPGSARDYLLYRRWLGELERSIQALEAVMPEASFSETLADGSKLTVTKGSARQLALADRLASLKAARADPVIEARDAEARQSAVACLYRLLYADESAD